MSLRYRNYQASNVYKRAHPTAEHIKKVEDYTFNTPQNNGAKAKAPSGGPYLGCPHTRDNQQNLRKTADKVLQLSGTAISRRIFSRPNSVRQIS